MNEFDEIPQAIGIMRVAIEDLELMALAGDQPEEALKTILAVISAAEAYGKSPPRRGQPYRGVGYGQMGKDGYTTPDEAMIVASLPWFKNNLNAAIRAQFPNATPDDVKNHADRIRRRQVQIREVEGDDRPWENSGNWLGDLIAK